MTLHILSQPPSHNAYQSCLQHLTPQDTLILINDGVYALQDPLFSTTCRSQQVFAIAADTQARGITTKHQQAIDYDAFVALSCQHSPIQSWY